jgi:hypothetical protein
MYAIIDAPKDEEGKLESCKDCSNQLIIGQGGKRQLKELLTAFLQTDALLGTVLMLWW